MLKMFSKTRWYFPLFLVFVLSLRVNSTPKVDDSLKINTSNPKAVNECTIWSVPVEYQNILINMKKANNDHDATSQVIMMVSQDLMECAEANVSTCEGKSGFCQSTAYDATEGSSALEYELNACVKTAYLYLLPKTTQMVSLDIFLEYESGTQKRCVQEEKSFSVACAQENPVTCNNNCNCLMLSCSGTTSFCVDKNLQSADLDKYCNAYGITGKKTTTEVCPSTTSDSDASPTEIILLTLLAIVILFIILVAYYRVSLRKSGQPPFSVPNFCPPALFPRSVGGGDGEQTSDGSQSPSGVYYPNYYS